MKKLFKYSFSRPFSMILAAALMLQCIPGFSIPSGAAEPAEYISKEMPVGLDESIYVSAYDSTYTDQWTAMYPTGQPDNSTTWPGWAEGVNHGSIAYNGYKDIGALHLISSPGKNTGVAINAGMTVGQTYTLGMYVKGTSNSGKVLALYANGDPVIIADAQNLTADWSYYEISFTAAIRQLNILAPDWGNTDIYIDNITLKNRYGKDLLAGKGDFWHTASVAVAYEPTAIALNRVSDAYNCRFSECWVPMYPTGKPDGNHWSAWDSSHCAQIVEDGYLDAGALYMTSIVGSNTAVAINAGMTAGERYTIGMYVKGVTNNSNKALALYGNGDSVLIGNPQYSPDGTVGSQVLTTQWSYVEQSFTANGKQLNLLVPDWGRTEVYIDNITLKDSEGVDLLSGYGDFCQPASTAEKDANFDFEANADGTPYQWSHKGVLADSTASLYSEHVYSGNRALRVHRQNGELDCSFMYSQVYIPVMHGDEIELTAHIASRNSISGNFSMFVWGYEAPGGDYVDFAYGQERITNAGSSWSQWDTYELTYTVPDGVKYIKFGLRIGGTNADVLVDDLTYYNYTENNDRIYHEDFAAPSITTGLPGGWTQENAGTITANGNWLLLSGDEAGNPSVSTELYTLRTGYSYALTADVMTDGTATGVLKLEKVNWKGECAGDVVALNLRTGADGQQYQIEFVAESAVYYRLVLEKIGGNGNVSIDDISIRITAKPSPKENSADSSTGSIPGAGTAAPTTTSSVETIGGKTYMLVNGEPVVPLWFARPENPILFEEHTITEFAKVGVDTVVTYVFLNNMYGDVWTEEGFSSEAIDNMMAANLAGNPNAKFIVALDFNAPQWWCDANPGELAALANTTPARTNASFASEKWKRESGQIMNQAIDYMMAQSYADQIIGLKVTAGYTLEWNWWAISGVNNDVGDFSECGIAAYRQWLTKKYGTDSALQAAYGNSSITLSNAMPPSALQRSDDYLDTVITVQDHPEMMDYEMYMAELKADTIEYFAALAKNAVNDRLVVGTYGGYFYMGGGYEFSSATANVYFQRLLQSEHLDFIKSPWVYGMREIGDSGEFMGPVDSLDLYGKLWIIEEDTRLNLQKMYGKQDDNAAVGWTRNYQQSVEQLKRNYAYILSKGMGISFYNLMWNFTDDEQYYGAIGQMYEEMEKSLCLTSESTADIAVFVDGQSQMLIPYEEGYANSILYLSVFKEQLKELGHVGASYDMYLLDDLADGLVPEHKINIFLATTMVTEQERAAIESRLQKNGNILVWIFTDGICDGKTTDIRLMESLTGMELSLLSTARQKNATAKISNTTHWLTAGMNLNQPYGVETYDKMSPVIGVSDSGATALGYHTAFPGETALAVKDMGDWISIYSAVPNLPQSLFRNMLNYVGGHVYTDSPSDVIYANSDYVALHSIFAGERTVYLPEIATVYDVFSGKVIAQNADRFTVTLKGKETCLFRLIRETQILDTLNTDSMTGAYAAPDAWTPMYPAGTPDSGTWKAWDDDHYGEIVENGYLDPGALHLKSYYYKNTGVAIHAGMTPGESYTLGLWAKGTTDSGRVLALYANSDPVIIQTPDMLKADWRYYEITFTAALPQINLVAADWGNTDIYIDHITLKDSSENDLLAGRGDFSHWSYDNSHNWITASCTAAKHCFACGISSGKIPGHSYGQWVVTTPATLADAGVQQKICVVCGDIQTEEIPCLAGDVEAWSLTLGGDLSVNFMMRIHEDIRDEAVVVISVAGEAHRFAVSRAQPDAVSGTYRFTVPVAAAQMGDAITVQIVRGEDASVTKTYSVLAYAEYVLSDSQLQSYHALVREMLNYGAAAQDYFDYNTENPVNANVSGVGQASVPKTWEQGIGITGNTEGVEFYGASLVFEDKTAVRFYFTVSGDVGAFTFQRGDEVLRPIQKGEYWYVEIPGILPQGLDETVTLTVSGGLAVTYSPMHYIVRMHRKGSDTLKALVHAMYNYHLAAEAFLSA